MQGVALRIHAALSHVNEASIPVTPSRLSYVLGGNLNSSQNCCFHSLFSLAIGTLLDHRERASRLFTHDNTRVSYKSANRSVNPTDDYAGNFLVSPTFSFHDGATMKANALVSCYSTIRSRSTTDIRSTNSTICRQSHSVT